MVLAHDFFVDSLLDQQLQIYDKKAHTVDLQVALATALEFETFLRTTSGLGKATQPYHDLQGRKSMVKEKAASMKAHPVSFHGSCWGCCEKEHRRSRCTRERRTRSLDRPSSDAFQPCYKDWQVWPTLERLPQALGSGAGGKRTGWRRGPNPSRPQSPGSRLV